DDVVAGVAQVGRGVRLHGPRADDSRVAGTRLPGDRRRRVVHRVGVPVRVADVALVLDADRMRVVRAHVPGLLALAHHLRDLSVGTADQVVRADLRTGVLEPGDRAGVAALHGVDRDLAH